ncbi:MAG: hypothetical protein Q8P90_03925 [bacterium]|nr:hypothetical protein [bacterium]
MEEDKFVCIKCGKEKNKSEGIHQEEDKDYCCQQCCGSEQKLDTDSDGNCEFC